MQITMKHGAYCKGEVLDVAFHHYETGTTAIVLRSPLNGEMVAVATVNFPGELAEDEVALKGWSENEGVPQDLIDAGIVEPAHRYIASGFVKASVHRIAAKHGSESRSITGEDAGRLFGRRK